MADVLNRPEYQSELFNNGPAVSREASGGDRVDASLSVKG
jgi:hypothetical protein